MNKSKSMQSIGRHKRNSSANNIGFQDQLLSACPNTAYMEVHAFGIEEYISYPLIIKDGHGIASERPGIGFEFDFDKLIQYKTN